MSEILDKDELDNFMDSVDKIIEDLESGKEVDLDEVMEIPKEASEIVVVSTATTIGEEEMVERTKVDRSERLVVGNLPKDREIIGKIMANMVVITDKEGKETVYGNAGSAASNEGVNASTARQRCEREAVDNQGRTWKYEPSK